MITGRNVQICERDFSNVTLHLLLPEKGLPAVFNKGALLTQQTATRILTRQPNSSMGLGFTLVNGKAGLIFNHSGSAFGYKSYVSVYRDRGQGIAIMMNGDNEYALIMDMMVMQLRA